MTNRIALLGACLLVACGTTTETVTVPGECADATAADVLSGDGTVVDDSSASDSGAPGTDTGSPSTDTGVASTDTGAPPFDSGMMADASPGCSIKTGGDLCNKINKFTGTQVVDAIGDEFCDVPATIFQVKKGVTRDGSLPGPVTDVVSARVAWDAKGIHAHFHVDDPVIVRQPIYIGPDALHFFIGGDTPTYGKFDGNTYDDGFVQIDLSPPSTTGMTILKHFTGGFPAMAEMWFWSPTSTSGGYFSQVTAPAQWAARLVSGGWEAELFVPWSVLGRTSAPTAGTTIAADLGASVCDDPGAWAADAKYPICGTPYSADTFLAIKPVSATSTCNGWGGLAPTCDDRTWCQPTLE